jgi:hypothetical protein
VCVSLIGACARGAFHAIKVNESRGENNKALFPQAFLFLFPSSPPAVAATPSKYSFDPATSGLMVLEPGSHPAGQTSPCCFFFFFLKERGKREVEEEEKRKEKEKEKKRKKVSFLPRR